MLGWALVGAVSAQTSAGFTNSGVIFFPPAPPIDATTVENRGTIGATNFTGTTALFDTQNTLRFINTGTMIGNPGFQFDYVKGDWGLRYPLLAFTNQGSIFATDNILIYGTNIVNLPGGKLSADRGGRVRLEAASGAIDLLSSRIRAGDSSERFNNLEGGVNFTTGTYILPNNAVDQYWGGGDGGNLILSTLRSGGFSNPRGHGVTNRGGFTFTEFLNVNPPVDTNFPTFPGYSFFIYTNYTFSGPATGRTIRGVVQMVFVQTNLPGSPLVRVYFQSLGRADNLRNAVIEFGIDDLDNVSGQPFTRYVRLSDRLATNAAPAALVPPALFGNSRQPGNFRTDNYSVTRGDNQFNPGGETPASDFDPNYIWSFPTLLATNIGAAYQTNVVPHVYGACQFSVQPRDVGGGGTAADFVTGNPIIDQLNDPTNSAGRVELVASQLNLNFATIRADNLISIQASNITSLAGLRADAENVDLQLFATNGSFVLSNGFPNTVNRLNGQVSVWSGAWQVDQFVTNSAQFGITNIPGVLGVSGTNTINYIYQMMVVDLDNFVRERIDNGVISTIQSRFVQLQTNQPVAFQNFRVNAASVQLHDTNVINRSFFLGGDSWLIGSNGVVTLGGANSAFTAANAPRLTSLTNLGVFSAPVQANFGAGRLDAALNPFPYSNIVNRGSIFSGSLQFAARNFENSSNLFAASGAVEITATTNRLSGGAITAAGRIDLSGNELFITANTATNPVFNAGGKLSISVTDRVSDSSLTNVWNLSDGMALFTRPAKGDLLSTRIVSAAGTNQSVVHFWAGENRGDSASGYANNAALGELVLDGRPGSLFVFFPALGQTNALYVDTLTFTNNSTNFSTALQVDPNLTIYFAKANVPGDKLTNAFGGRLVWVGTSTRLGPLVSVKTSMARTMTLTTQEYQAMVANNPDVDGDGIPNELDETPFSGFAISSVRLVNGPPMIALISWQALAGTAYTVEYRSGLEATVWTVLNTWTASAGGMMTAADVVPPGGQRFYRVRYGH